MDDREFIPGMGAWKYGQSDAEFNDCDDYSRRSDHPAQCTCGVCTVQIRVSVQKLVVVLFTTGSLIPIHSTLVPLFIMMKNIGLLDTYGALILPYTAFESPIAIFLAMAYMSSIPREIEEAAMIDGGGWWGIFGRMILPLCTPIVATISILAFLRFWNDFSFALVFINTQALKTLPLSLSLFSDGFGTDYSLTMGAMAIAVIPTIVAYLILQEQIMKGMVAGSIKG